MYATFISFKFSHLSKSGASKKYVFTDCSVLTDSAFYFSLPLFLCWMDFFVPLTFSSFVQYPEVLRMIVSPLNMWNFWLCTNPLMSLFRVWCGGSFQGSREENDIIWSRRVKSLSLGMPPWFIPAYFKKTQASKLGDAQGIPFFIDNLSGFFSWNYIFIRSHLMYFTWSVCLFLFLFLFE